MSVVLLDWLLVVKAGIEIGTRHGNYTIPRWLLATHGRPIQSDEIYTSPGLVRVIHKPIELSFFTQFLAINLHNFLRARVFFLMTSKAR